MIIYISVKNVLNTFFLIEGLLPHQHHHPPLFPYCTGGIAVFYIVNIRANRGGGSVDNTVPALGNIVGEINLLSPAVVHIEGVGTYFFGGGYGFEHVVQYVAIGCKSVGHGKGRKGGKHQYRIGGRAAAYGGKGYFVPAFGGYRYGISAVRCAPGVAVVAGVGFEGVGLVEEQGVVGKAGNGGWGYVHLRALLVLAMVGVAEAYAILPC